MTLLAGCVSLDELPPSARAGLETTAAAEKVASFPDLDPGSTSLTTLHFTVKGYTEYQIRPISITAETLYNKIGNDTGLYTFLASGSYTLVVYRDRDEYLTKTRQPQWSRAVTAGTSIYLYPDTDLDPVLAHELTHLIFQAYMGEKGRTFRWLNEGLAMHEELSAMTEGDRQAYASSKSLQLRDKRLPFSQMAFFIPNTEERRRVETWYQQVESVVSFLLAQGGGLNFAQMLNNLRGGIDIDRALSDAYPGKFRSLTDLENTWKFTI